MLRVLLKKCGKETAFNSHLLEVQLFIYVVHVIEKCSFCLAFRGSLGIFKEKGCLKAGTFKTKVHDCIKLTKLEFPKGKGSSNQMPR